MRLINSDVNEFLRTVDNLSVNIVITDPPYSLGNKVVIGSDGKPNFKNKKDFMNKWEMPDGIYWEEFFKESFRLMKHGGFMLMFGIDKNLLLFKYYAALAGYEEVQSLYWYFTSSLPKASNLSKNIDRRYGLVGEYLETVKGVYSNSGSGIYNMNTKSKFKKYYAKLGLVHPIAKKYEGYRYAITPLKATNETIMVFRKPFKTSMIDDIIDLENGDITINCSALNVENNYTPDGKYPAQTFIESGIEIPGAVDGVATECSFTDDDFDCYIHESKVGVEERHAGVLSNNHTTLKPIELMFKIGKLFKSAGEQSVLVPFSGTGSEMIGFYKAGFRNITGIELDKHNIEIAEQRIKHWEDIINNKSPELFDDKS
jgi:site-specific DNA-methyltransferase (adenine-specific)